LATLFNGATSSGIDTIRVVVSIQMPVWRARAELVKTQAIAVAWAVGPRLTYGRPCQHLAEDHDQVVPAMSVPADLLIMRQLGFKPE
jgi:hypothetical protein